MVRNRARCKKCGDTIESHLSNETVFCKCGAVAVCDGPALRCLADEWEYFVRLDDDGNEIIPTVIESGPVSDVDALHAHVKNMIETLTGLPSIAMDQPLTHRDYLDILRMISILSKR